MDASVIAILSVGGTLAVLLVGLVAWVRADIRAVRDDLRGLRTEIAEDRRAHEAKHDREVVAGLRTVQS